MSYPQTARDRLDLISSCLQLADASLMQFYFELAAQTQCWHELQLQLANPADLEQPEVSQRKLQETEAEIQRLKLSIVGAEWNRKDLQIEIAQLSGKL